MDASTLLEKGQLVYIQEGVFLQTSRQAKAETDLISGSLVIVEETYGNFIIWRSQEEGTQSVGSSPKELSGWAMVNNNGCKYQNGTDCVELNSIVRPLIVEIGDLSSYRLGNHGKLVTLTMKDGTTHPSLWFECDAADGFIGALQKYLKVKKSKKEDDLFILTDPKVEALDKSFSELQIFENRTTDFVRGFINELKHDPVNTTVNATMTGFSKLYDVVSAEGIIKEKAVPERRESREATTVHGTGTTSESRPETEIAEIYRSLSSAEFLVHEEEYEVVTAFRLAQKPTVTRTSPVDDLIWCQHLGDDGNVLNVESLKEKIFHGGIIPELRKDLWKFLLGYYPWNTTFAQRTLLRRSKEEAYFRMKRQWKTIDEDQEKRFSAFSQKKGLVEKDVARTDRTVDFYAGDNCQNLIRLNDILITYCMYNFDLGYVQGMSDLLSPILYVMEDEVDAFWCFVGFMDRVASNFELKQDSMKTQLLHLHTLLSVAQPSLCSYLEGKDSGNLYFCFRWLLILFKREFSFMDIQRLWEVLWTDHLCANFHLIVCLSLLDMQQNSLMENQYDFTGILKHINELSGKLDLQRTLENAEAIYLQLKASEHLSRPIKEIIGMEDDFVEETSPSSQRGKDDDNSSIEVLPDELDDSRFETAIGLNFM